MKPEEQALIDLALSRGGTLGPSVSETITQTREPVPSNERWQDRGQGSPRMVKASVIIFCGKLIALIPCVTRTEANESAWVRKMRRKLSAKRATRETLGRDFNLLTQYGEAYHAGKALRMTFTRLGGRRLDRCNLSTSMKSVEDVVAGALLADDGSPLWMVSYEQDIGAGVGVRVEIEVMP